MENTLYLISSLSCCALLLFSFAGWGQTFLTILRYKEKVDFATLAIYGISFLCVGGGILNLTHTISPRIMLWIIICGLTIFILNLKRHHKCSDVKTNFAIFRNNLPLTLILFLLITINLVTGCIVPLNPHDDFHAYLAFPQQMLQTGEIVPDPFNERRLGVLGGQSFLDALLLSIAPFRFLVALENVLGWFLFHLLIFSDGIRKKILPAHLLFFIILLCAFNHPSVNLSSHFTSLIIFYVLFRRCSSNIHTARNEIILSSFLLSALLSLKSTNFIGVVIIGAVIFCFDNGRLSLRKARQGIVIFFLAIFLLLPWMISLFLSSDTLFYPILGKGTQISWQNKAAPISIRLIDFNLTYIKMILVSLFSQYHIFFSLLLLLLSKSRNNLNCIPMNIRLVFYSAILAAIVLFLVSLGIERYSYPFTFAAYSLLSLEFLSLGSKNTYVRSNFFGKHTWLINIFLFLSLICTFSSDSKKLESRASNLKKYYKDPPNIPEHLTPLMRKAQHSVPPGKKILAVLSYPFLLDYARNPLYTVDHAGSAGPNQESLLFDSGQELVTYLRKKNINYIYYSYSDEGFYGRRLFSDRLNFYGSPYRDRIRILTENNIKLRDLILELSPRNIIYKDNYSVIIKLDLSPEF